MSDRRHQRIRKLFDAVVDLDPAERASYLEAHCSDEPALRGEVEALVSLDRSTVHGAVLPVVDSLRPQAPPERIGPYRILKPLGEGGFGEVYEVEQTEPFQRRVALKIVKAGMDTRAVLARFEAERQALALMNHPGIAKVHDAGATEAGRSYFVMELVKGERITTFCDRARLPVPERIALFLAVCEAVQHAHQRGIIHRDLKPSNVLVTDENGAPAPKVIDFGIAKATGLALTPQTLFTEEGVLLGTPAYMSPEQAELGGLDVDIRTDVYSLGVVLYELLTGSVPFDPRTIETEGLAKYQKKITEEEAQKPSTRASAAEGVGEVARSRNTNPGGLSRMLRGDLDWIVLKALEKDRTRRYGSAAELADDLRRHLTDRPVEAGPPDPVYRARKFLKRYRVPVAVAGIVFASILYALFESNRQRLVAEDARQEAELARDEAEAVTEFLADMLESTDPREQGAGVTVREVLDDGAATIDEEFADQPLVRARLMATMGNTYRKLGLYPEAKPLLEEALAIRRERLGSHHDDVGYSSNILAIWHLNQGETAEAREYFEQALEAWESAFGPDHPSTATCRNNLGNTYWRDGDYQTARDLFAEALEAHERVSGPEDIEVARSAANLGGVSMALGKYEEAGQHLQRALAIRQKQLGADHPDVAEVHLNLGVLGWYMGDVEAAVEAHEKAQAIQKKTLGPDHPERLHCLGNLGMLYLIQEKYDESRRYLEETQAGAERHFGPDENLIHLNLTNLAVLEQTVGNHARSQEHVDRACAILERRGLLDHQMAIPSIQVSAELAVSAGNHALAREHFEHVLAIQEETFGPDHLETAVTLDSLAVVAKALGDTEGAAELVSRAEKIRAAADE